jgi:hypothetical protein
MEWLILGVLGLCLCVATVVGTAAACVVMVKWAKTYRRRY